MKIVPNVYEMRAFAGDRLAHALETYAANAQHTVPNLEDIDHIIAQTERAVEWLKEWRATELEAQPWLADQNAAED